MSEHDGMLHTSEHAFDLHKQANKQSPAFKALLYNLVFLSVGSGLCSPEKNTENNCFPHRIRQVFL